MEEPEDKFEVVMSAQSDKAKPLPSLRKSRDGFNRGDVVNAFQSAFQIIGGVQRLALWANQNPGEFYKLYARLMPSNAINIFAQGEKVIIEHAVGRTPLDDHPHENE